MQLARHNDYSFFRGQGGRLPFQPEEVRVGGHDGDGRADVLYEGDDGKIHVLLSTGSSFQPDTVWGSRALPYDNVTPPCIVPAYRLADVNGDGLPDFVYNGYDAATGFSEFRVLKNRGGINPADAKGFEPDMS